MGGVMANSVEKVEQEKRLYKRLILTFEDLQQAKSFASALLSPLPTEKAVRDALEIAMIVSYWRPFSNNKGSKDAKKTLPTKNFLMDFNDDNHKAHSRIKDLRNTVMAHSDSNAYGIHVSTKKIKDAKITGSLMRNPWVSMSNSEISLIIENIDKISLKVTDEILRIQNCLPEETKF
jgi:hypothetical protein